MPDTRCSKDRIKNHLHYGKWIYIGIAVLAFLLVDLVYTMTEYRPDRYHRVDIQLVGNSIFDDEALTAVAQKALEDVSPTDENLEEVNILNIAYSGDATTDIYGAQKYTVMLAEGSSAIYVVNREMLENLVAQGGALPLEPYVESGVLPAALAVTLPEADDEGNPTSVRRVFAVDLSGLNKMQGDDIAFDNRDKYAVVFAACVNPDTATRVLRSMIDQLTGPTPDSDFARNLLAAADAAATTPDDLLASPEAAETPAPEAAAAAEEALTPAPEASTPAPEAPAP